MDLLNSKRLFLLTFVVALFSCSFVSGLSITNIANNTCVYDDDSITLSATVVPLEEVNSVWLKYSIDGIETVVPVTDPTGDLYSYVLSLSGLGGKSVFWSYYANDTSNVTFDGGVWKNFNVNNGITIENKTEVILVYETDNVTLSADIGPSSEINSTWISYTINGTNFNESVTEHLGDRYSYVLDHSKLVGGSNVTWNYYARDDCGNEYNNGWQTFNVKEIITIGNKSVV